MQDVLNQNEMEENQLRDKISQYLQLRTNENTDSATEDNFVDDEGSI